MGDSKRNKVSLRLHCKVGYQNGSVVLIDGSVTCRSSKQTAVVRASDDFWPRDPASHTIHIASVAYNSLFLAEFMQPDWDMFHVILLSKSCSLLDPFVLGHCSPEIFPG